MEAMTASLERSLKNCSLNHQTSCREDDPTTDADVDADVGIGISSSSDDVPVPLDNHFSNSDTTLELNSHISLPHHWEQCLDLKTGEIYYINWKNGMKAKEDPRRTSEYNVNNRYYESEEESRYDSEESSSESCTSSSKEHYAPLSCVEKQNVLVVAGCKSCLMYFMVPKQVEDCPKCSGQLLHFDRSENGSP
ncbi:protein CURLY FLAG LEAF 1-like isoform X2 [Lotus japonicus]|nr:protein CURLY FLAG LEAF 1-like isoform X2 [Lotus japonicus]